jgi:hypothetical protein
MVVKRGKDTLPSLLAFLNQILTTHLAAPPEAKNHQVLRIIISMK